MEDLNTGGNRYLTLTSEIKESIQTYPDSVYFGGSIGFLSDPDFMVLEIEEMTISQLAIGMQKNSEFKKVFDYHLTKQMQSGLVTYLRNKYAKHGRLDDIGHLDEDPTDAVDSLSYSNLLLPFIILCFGIVIGGIVYCIEYFRNVMKKKVKAKPIEVFDMYDTSHLNLLRRNSELGVEEFYQHNVLEKPRQRRSERQAKLRSKWRYEPF